MEINIKEFFEYDPIWSDSVFHYLAAKAKLPRIYLEQMNLKIEGELLDRMVDRLRIYYKGIFKVNLKNLYVESVILSINTNENFFYTGGDISEFIKEHNQYLFDQVSEYFPEILPGGKTKSANKID